MIVASKSQDTKPKVSPIGVRPSKAGYLPGAYEIGKTMAKGYGYYKDIEPYLPDRYIEKYTYKPHKRVTGYLGQTFHSKKTVFKSTQSRRFNEECSRDSGLYRHNCY